MVCQIVCINKKSIKKPVFMGVFRDEARHGRGLEGLLKRYFK